MSLKTTGVPFAHRQYTRRAGPSQETKNVLKLGAEIKSIKRATEYIKENGQKPPETPQFYMKKLNSF